MQVIVINSQKGGSAKTMLAKHPVSYTHLDVYKRQHQPDA